VPAVIACESSDIILRLQEGRTIQSMDLGQIFKNRVYYNDDGERGESTPTLGKASTKRAR